MSWLVFPQLTSASFQSRLFGNSGINSAFFKLLYQIRKLSSYKGVLLWLKHDSYNTADIFEHSIVALFFGGHT